MSSATRTKWEGRMDQMKGRIKEAWGVLTDDDIDRSNGNWDRLIGTVKEKTGESMESIEKTISSWFDRM